MPSVESRQCNPWPEFHALILKIREFHFCKHTTEIAGSRLKDQIMKKILIIEDDQKIAMALEVRFHANGYATVMARDCDLGATLARSASPDLIVLDISL